MVKELYSCGCLSELSMSSLQDFVDYIDSLQTTPDICLAYRADNARGHGLYTTIWVNHIEVQGIFGYLDSDNIKKHLIYEIITLSKWDGIEIRTKRCR